MDFSAEFAIGVGELQLKPEEFWQLTYAELLTLADGRIKSQKRKMNEMLFLAWHIEALARQKKLPALSSLLKDDKTTGKQQSDEEMMNMAKLLNAAFGGEVIEVYGDTQ
nr:phage tail assembly chaperone [Gudongella oleilytica]